MCRGPHPPGHAQADFGEAWAIVDGRSRKVRFPVVDLPQSDAMFLKAYPAETAEAFCDGHVAAFAIFGGVPLSILYDDTRLAGDGLEFRVRASMVISKEYPRCPDANPLRYPVPCLTGC
ncbi:MAG: hypothetical protein ACI9ZH_001088 [Paracoccaceae bacterium]